MSLTLPKLLPCAGKAKHETHKAAAKELRRNDGKRMGIYKCRDCGAFHIGHDRADAPRNTMRNKLIPIVAIAKGVE
jgi:hypothetical protein